MVGSPANLCPKGRSSDVSPPPQSPSPNGVPLSYELLFTIANGLATVCWLPLVFAPRSAFTQRFVATPLAPLGFAVAYLALVVVMFATPGEGSMGSLADLRVGFQRDSVLLLAWVHYLSFDMMVGMWEVRDSTRLGLSPWRVAPCLVFTFLLGPVGLLLYMLLRFVRRRSLRFDAEA